jgi:hypothetical protein
MISLFCRATWGFVLLLSFGVQGLISERFWGLLLGFRLPRSKRGISNFKGTYLLCIYVFAVEIHAGQTSGLVRVDLGVFFYVKLM